MSNAKRRHRRRRRHRLSTEWWHMVIAGHLVLYPPWARRQWARLRGEFVKNFWGVG